MNADTIVGAVIAVASAVTLVIAPLMLARAHVANQRRVNLAYFQGFKDGKRAGERGNVVALRGVGR